VKERPILFSGEMVRAILAGRKTQTRRVIKDATGAYWDHRGYQPVVKEGSIHHWIFQETGQVNPYWTPRDCPYGQPGDRLWVREAFIVTPPCWTDNENDYNIRDDNDEGRIIEYTATCDREAIRCAADYHLHVRPSIHMPYWASRIKLEVTKIHAQRVQEISGMDAKREGVNIPAYLPQDGADLDWARMEYSHLWDRINAKRGFTWESNPWVWVVEFKVIHV
jgi:hypothetical protein